MSDGGGENGRERTQSRKSGGADDFARAIAKVAVAQICESEGFQAFQSSALETLSDIALRYIQSIGKSAHLYANLAGRTECNVFDIIQGLEDLGSVQGFSGASFVGHSLSSSGVVREIVQYVDESDHIPFAYTIPEFPVVKERKLTPSFLQTGEEPPEEHIPPWLPVFPEPHTYAQLPIPDEKAVEPMVRMELQKHRKVDQTLMNLHQQMVSNGSEGPSSVYPGDPDKVKQAEESNPFLAAPLEFGEKEVSGLVLPAKLSDKGTMTNLVVDNHVMDNRIAVLETFAPAIEAMKESSFDTEEQKGVLLNRRPTVRFKIGIGKKSLGNLIHSSLENESSEKISPWFEGESEKDEKKRRAGEILKESMENSQGLAQL
ncbi:transcription initiation factor TFIID subunit 8 [Humulus lupulus]|uniref:transcription initiation factor TFIID subunit 8 n=1 Tax=Humulus lupulus TaxID=3486 RepID=UPI002B40D7C1|nr:transcription initiation factor TFIID subunit 8 [Humulus lupulus]